MLARSTESVLVEPENSPRGGAHNQQHEDPLQDAGTSEYQHSPQRILGWTRKNGKRRNPVRRPPRRRPTTTCVRRDGDSSPKIPLLPEVRAVKNSVRYHQALPEFLQHTLVAEKQARTQRSTRRPWPFSTRNIDWGTAVRPATFLLGAMCHYFPEFGKHGGHFLPRSRRALQGWKRRTPPRSRDPHVWCIWTVPTLEFLRQGHWSMGDYLLWMVTCYFRPGEPLFIQRGDVQIPIQGISSRHQVLLYPENRPLRSKTYAATRSSCTVPGARACP